MKKHDFILIGLIMVIIFSLVIILLCLKKDGKIAKVYLNGNEVLTIDLSIDNEYKVDGNISEVIIKVKDGSIAIIESSCSDHTCINMGYTSNSSKTIVCMPNGIYIKVLSEDGNTDVIIG